MSDPIADLLIRIKNGYLARKDQVETPWSKILEEIAQILVAHGYLDKARAKKNKFKTLVLDLKYKNKKPAFCDVRRISKPGVRCYVRASRISRGFSGSGIVIISTSEGVMTGPEAKKKNLGGEILAEIW